MAHTFATNLVHVVFSTKERANTIPSDRIPRLVAYVEGIGRAEGFGVVAAGGISDHLHLLLSIPPKKSLSEVVQKLKGNTSRWMGTRFAWQQGYGAFSVSPSHADAVSIYIRSQLEHHKKRDFEQEFIALLKKCGVEYDPRFVFG